jgi:hypothetical protein
LTSLCSHLFWLFILLFSREVKRHDTQKRSKWEPDFVFKETKFKKAHWNFNPIYFINLYTHFFCNFQNRHVCPGKNRCISVIRTLWYALIAIFNPSLTKLTHDYLIILSLWNTIVTFSMAFNQVFSCLLSIVVDIDIAHTLLRICAFICGAVGVYVLIKSRLNNNVLSLVAKLGFAFSSFHFAHSFCIILEQSVSSGYPVSSLLNENI